MRHGESEENAGAVIVGDTTPLSEKGRVQAGHIAERALNLSFDVVISSSLVRARQTASHIVEQTHKNVEISDLFRERKMPSIGLGKTIHDPEMVAMEERLVAHLVDHEHRHSDEENFSDLKSRAQSALKYLEERPEENILVVTHGAFLKMLIGEVLFGSRFSGQEAVCLMQKMTTMNTGITVFLFEPEHRWGPWRLLTYNDHAHLG